MNLIKRILVAFVAIPILLWLIHLGGIYLLILISILSFLMSFEMINIFRKKNIKLSYFFTFFSPIITVFCSIGKYEMAFLLLFFSFLILASINIFSNKLDFSLNKFSALIFIFFYPAFLISFLYKIAQVSTQYLILLIILIWITDTGAYFIGMTLGKHRGFILASPKKSIEGFIGGFLFSLIFSLSGSILFSSISTKIILFLAISTGIFGQLGDLIESIIKRDANIKDSSSFIPGHGGFLDRFDSLIISAPIFYFFYRMF